MKEINNKSYLSIQLKVESIENGQLNAVMSWPVAHYYGPVTIDLSSQLKKLKGYNEELGFHAHRITNLNENKIKELKLWQKNLAEEFGQCFYESAFEGFLEQLGDQADGRVILLGIYIPAGLLESLPWELLGSPHNTCFKKSKVIFSIYRAVESESWTYVKKNHTTLLYLSSYPLDKTVQHSEFPVISEALRGNPKIELRSEGHYLTYYQFCDFVRTKPDIVHLSVHGAPNGEGFYFVRDQGSQIAPIHTLVTFLKQVESIKLLVLNACYSATPHIYDAYAIASIARQLVDSGLPAVIGMANAITDKAAIEFSQWFYKELKETASVRQAFHTAIDNLRNSNQPDSLLWSVPMLHVSDDVNPFAEALEDIVRENYYYAKPLELLEETASLLGEFTGAFKRIQFLPLDSELQWQLQSNSLSRIQNQIQPQLNILKQQLQSINQLSNRALILDVERLISQISTDWPYFLRLKPDWENLELSDPKQKKKLVTFLSVGTDLVTKTENLITKINMLTRSR